MTIPESSPPLPGPPKTIPTRRSQALKTASDLAARFLGMKFDRATIS
jgi:hypothetical protein